MTPYEFRPNPTKSWQDQLVDLQGAVAQNDIVQTTLAPYLAEEFLPQIIRGAMNSEAVRKYISGLNFREFNLTPQANIMSFSAQADISFEGAAKLLGSNREVHLTGSMVIRNGIPSVEGLGISITNLNFLQRNAFDSQKKKIIEMVQNADIVSGAKSALEATGISVENLNFGISELGLHITLQKERK